MHKYLLERDEGHVFSYLLDENTRALEIRRDPLEAEDSPGDIFKARIMNIASGINAAFVRYKEGVNGYLPLDAAENAFYFHKSTASGPRAGDELLVQVKKIPEGEKLVSLTADISIAGDFTVADASVKRSGVSSKISGDRSRRLKELAGQLADEDFGIVIRTAAENASDDDITKEAVRLKKRLKELLDRAPYASCPSCLYKQPPMWLMRLNRSDITAADEILTDDKELFGYLNEWAVDDKKKAKLRFYENRMQSMHDCYRLGRELSRALDRKIWLDSGAFLVIEPTEALTVIDVNSGKATGRIKNKESEEVFLKLNMEAAKEAAAQLRLRNICGMIIIDFINMREEASRMQLQHFLQRELDKDPVRSKAVDFTKLNLMEITRQRKELPLGAVYPERTGEKDHEL